MHSAFPAIGDTALNMAELVRRHATLRPNAPAIYAHGESQTYGEFCESAQQLGSWLKAQEARRIAILGSRSIGACHGVVGAAWAGAAYVPLSLKAPSSRLADILTQSRCDALLIDRYGARLIDDTLIAACPPLIVAADAEARRLVEAHFPEIPVLSELQAPPMPPAAVAATDDAYIMFTSGTTGKPKGVIISVGARVALIKALTERYSLGHEDRVAETTDLSWDLSVANMIFAWRNGGSLHALAANEMVAPARFIRSRTITVWLSVPTVITTLLQRGTLRPDIFPSLRYSFFAGEGLPVHAAQAWSSAAPNSVVENLYGPTEATFTCIGHRFHAEETGNMVPIGYPYSTATAAIIDPNDHFLPDGEIGELILGGPQLATLYLDQPELTAERFPIIAGQRWYRTGDAAMRDTAGRFHHRGRIDNQLKVLGYRVELEDVEAHIRAACDAIAVAVTGNPPGAASVDHLIAFVVGGTMAPEVMRARLAQRLPAYMVPSAIQRVSELPLSANGKLDRARLGDLLDTQCH
jgi:amino acid adenylation domain-containing protein